MQYSDVQILDCKIFQSLQVEKLQEKNTKRKWYFTFLLMYFEEEK